MNNDAWLSLVERCVRDAEVAGSNPVASTGESTLFKCTFFVAVHLEETARDSLYRYELPEYCLKTFCYAIINMVGK